nr:hypothetical protein CFP56_12063 [Quercus suber]
MNDPRAKASGWKAIWETYQAGETCMASGSVCLRYLILRAEPPYYGLPGSSEDGSARSDAMTRIQHHTSRPLPPQPRINRSADNGTVSPAK